MISGLEDKLKPKVDDHHKKKPLSSHFEKKINIKIKK